MSKVRIIGPRSQLPLVVQTIQDLGLLHLSTHSRVEAVAPTTLSPAQLRCCRNLKRIIADVDAALLALQHQPATEVPGTAPDFAAGARLARKARQKAEGLLARRHTLDEEQALILKYQAFYSAFEVLLRHPTRWAGGHAFNVLLRPGQADSIARLRRELETMLGDEFELWTEKLPGGETALLLVVSPATAARVERLLTEGRIQEIPVPHGYGSGTLAEAVPRMLERLAVIPSERAALNQEKAELVRGTVPVLVSLRLAAHDELRRIEALSLSGLTAHTFVLEGWLPTKARERFVRALLAGAGESIVVENVAQEQWEGDGAPVVLHNPRLFRPFELIVRLLPLPRYGSMDPTPFVAVFFPMFFGVALGDLGYGAMLVLISLLLHLRSRPDTTLRSVAKIGGACAAFSLIFGLLYGEFFGNLGRRWGLHPLLFDREEAVIPFLALAVGLGVMHIVLGLTLGVFSAHTRKERLGHGITAAMVVLIILALLAAVEILPKSLFTPVVIALLVAFPILVVAEGLIAPIELLSTLGNVLSYARIMALGTASVMLAVVANRMIGTMGSAVVGITFALLFHLVNFALALFSPTIHALRLHYVEFFGKFYSPGGVQYQPLSHHAAASSPPANSQVTREKGGKTLAALQR